MNWFDVATIYLIVMPVVAVYWSAYIRTLNGSNYARMSVLLCVAMGFYIFGYAMELNAATPGQVEFWNRTEYIGIPYVSALWLTIALMYTGYFARHQKARAAAIFLIPAASMILRFTNDFHHLYFASVSFEPSCERLIYVKQAGPWMTVQAVYSIAAIFVSMALFIRDSMQYKETARGKILLTVAATAFAAAGLLLSGIKPFGHAVDYMALCLPVTALLVILAVAKYDLLETKAMGRSRVFECVSDAVLLINRRNKILDYNASAKHLFDSFGIRLDNGYAASLFRRVPDLLDALQKAETSVVRLSVMGEERYFEIITMRVDEQNATSGWIKTIRDVTQIHRLNEELKKQAMTDELSVLNNRRAFLNLGREWVAKANETGATLHLSILDLDHFKDVNDRYGHAAGDWVIRNIGLMLKDRFPKNSMIARLGGEEFAVLQSGLSDKRMYRMLGAFLVAAEQYEYEYGGYRFHVTASIGATRKQPGQALENMMLRADKALYQSKNGGRNRLTVG